jgi:cytosine/adenosine deaminase-related metal-dependent hydrolase
VQPTSLVSRDEATLFAVVGALEAIRTGSTTVVENVGGTAATAAALAKTGLRWVFAESATDREGGSPMSPEILARGEAPRFSPKMRDDGLQRIADLHSTWHGKENGRISVFPAAALAENSSPELLKAVRAFAEKHDQATRSTCRRAPPKWPTCGSTTASAGGLPRPPTSSHRAFRGALPLRGRRRHRALLAKTGTIVSHQAAMAANRGVIPPIPALRAAGVPIAMGTDNNTTDLFEVLRVALLTERIRRDDAFPGVQPQPEDILADATLGSARAVRQTATIGSLEVGKKADLLVPTPSASTSCRLCASCRRGSTTASRTTSSR